MNEKIAARCVLQMIGRRLCDQRRMNPVILAPYPALRTIIEVAGNLTAFHLGVAGLTVFLVRLTRGTPEIALFETILMLLQGIVEYHVPPPSKGISERINAASQPACLRNGAEYARHSH